MSQMDNLLNILVKYIDEPEKDEYSLQEAFAYYTEKYYRDVFNSQASLPKNDEVEQIYKALKTFISPPMIERILRDKTFYKLFAEICKSNHRPDRVIEMITENDDYPDKIYPNYVKNNELEIYLKEALPKLNKTVQPSDLNDIDTSHCIEYLSNEIENITVEELDEGLENDAYYLANTLKDGKNDNTITTILQNQSMVVLLSQLKERELHPKLFIKLLANPSLANKLTFTPKRNSSLIDPKTKLDYANQKRQIKFFNDPPTVEEMQAKIQTNINEYYDSLNKYKMLKKQVTFDNNENQSEYYTADSTLPIYQNSTIIGGSSYRGRTEIQLQPQNFHNLEEGESLFPKHPIKNSTFNPSYEVRGTTLPRARANSLPPYPEEGGIDHRYAHDPQKELNSKLFPHPIHEKPLNEIPGLFSNKPIYPHSYRSNYQNECTISQTKTISVQQALNIIPMYDGKRETFQSFALGCESAVKQLPSRELEIVRGVETRVTGEALTTLQTCSFNSMAQLIAYMEKRHAGGKTRMALISDLYNCVQGNERVISFVNRIKHIVIAIKRAIDREYGYHEEKFKELERNAMECLYNGLSPAIQIRVRPAENYEELVDNAIQAENISTRQEGTAKIINHQIYAINTNQNNCVFCHSSDHHSTECKKFMNRILGENNKIKCDICAKEDHIAKNCPIYLEKAATNNILKENKLCQICDKTNHTTANCFLYKGFPIRSTDNISPQRINRFENNNRYNNNNRSYNNESNNYRPNNTNFNNRLNNSRNNDIRPDNRFRNNVPNNRNNNNNPRQWQHQREYERPSINNNNKSPNQFYVNKDNTRPNPRYETVRKSEYKPYCEFHNSYSHSTEECRERNSRAQQFNEQGNETGSPVQGAIRSNQ